MTDPIVDFSGARRRGAAAQDRAVRGEETDIRQGGASAAASEASAERTRATTPVDIARTQSETATEEALRDPTVRRAEADATAAEARAEQLQRALARTSNLGGSARLHGDALAAAEQELQTTIGNLLQVRRLSRDMFSASGFGHEAVRDWWPGGAPAHDVSALLSQIGSFTALGRLLELKGDPRNETGGALGAITAPELQMLMNSAGNLDPSSGDAEFQAGVDDVLGKALLTYRQIGGDPYVLAEQFRPDEIEQYAPLMQSWRALPEDDAALVAYINNSRADGTYDPATYAALSAERYFNATGRQPTEVFVSNALDRGLELQSDTTPISGMNYEPADDQLRQNIVERVRGSEQPDTSVGSAVIDGITNFVPSAFQMVGDVAQALTSDLPQTVEGAGNIISGAAYDELVRQYGVPEPAPDNEAAAAWDAVQEHYGNRYGTREGFLQAVRTDPAGILADVAGLATAGATTTGTLARQAGRVGALARPAAAVASGADRVAQVAARVDPLRIATDVGGAGLRLGRDAVSNAATTIPARMAGTTAATVRQAADAGRRGSPAFTAQLDQAAGAVNPVDQLQGAISELYRDRGRAYNDRMASIDGTETVDFAAVDNAINDVRNIGRHRGIDISAAGNVWDAIDGKVGEFRDLGLNTVEDFDRMKQAVGNIRNGYMRGTPEYRVANDVYRSINDTIVDQAPVYANIMRDYREASDALTDIQASLSSGARSADTTLNRLQRAVAGHGPRGRTLVDILEATPSGRGLADNIAGRALQSREPTSMTSGVSLVGGATVNPAMLTAMAVTPHGVGRNAYRLGNAYGWTEELMRDVRALPPVAVPEQTLTALNARYQLAPRARTALTIANPSLIQPQVDPQPAPNESGLTPEERAIIQNAPQQMVPPVEVSGPGAGGVSLHDLQQQYGTSEPDISALAQRYGTVPQAEPLSAGGRRVQYDPATDEYVDLDSGERARNVQDFEPPAYRRGGRVRGV